jgi:hypothetical protein
MCRCNPLEPHDADRLIKPLSMCRGSHPSERAAAALKADTLIRSRGLICRDMTAFSRARRSQLMERERKFVEPTAGWCGQPSEKQLAWLGGIHKCLCYRDA